LGISLEGPNFTIKTKHLIFLVKTPHLRGIYFPWGAPGKVQKKIYLELFTVREFFGKKKNNGTQNNPDRGGKACSSQLARQYFKEKTGPNQNNYLVKALFEGPINPITFDREFKHERKELWVLVRFQTQAIPKIPFWGSISDTEFLGRNGLIGPTRSFTSNMTRARDFIIQYKQPIHFNRTHKFPSLKCLG